MNKREPLSYTNKLLEKFKNEDNSEEIKKSTEIIKQKFYRKLEPNAQEPNSQVGIIKQRIWNRTSQGLELIEKSGDEIYDDENEINDYENEPNQYFIPSIQYLTNSKLNKKNLHLTNNKITHLNWINNNHFIERTEPYRIGEMKRIGDGINGGLGYHLNRNIIGMGSVVDLDKLTPEQIDELEKKNLEKINKYSINKIGKEIKSIENLDVNERERTKWISLLEQRQLDLEKIKMDLERRKMESEYEMKKKLEEEMKAKLDKLVRIKNKIDNKNQLDKAFGELWINSQSLEDLGGKDFYERIKEEKNMNIENGLGWEKINADVNNSNYEYEIFNLYNPTQKIYNIWKEHLKNENAPWTQEKNISNTEIGDTYDEYENGKWIIKRYYKKAPWETLPIDNMNDEDFEELKNFIQTMDWKGETIDNEQYLNILRMRRNGKKMGKTKDEIDKEIEETYGDKLQTLPITKTKLSTIHKNRDNENVINERYLNFVDDNGKIKIKGITDRLYNPNVEKSTILKKYDENPFIYNNDKNRGLEWNILTNNALVKYRPLEDTKAKLHKNKINRVVLTYDEKKDNQGKINYRVPIHKMDISKIGKKSDINILKK